MANKINIKICVGTSCYVMGASDLLTFTDYLSPEKQKQINLECLTCIDKCKFENNPKPPFVIINGELMEKATIEKLIKKINELLK